MSRANSRGLTITNCRNIVAFNPRPDPPMFTHEGDILQAAATLAAAHYSSNATQGRGPSAARAPTDTSVDVLINILREMERKQLIPPGLAPK
jgi:hypothetical protein